MVKRNAEIKVYPVNGSKQRFGTGIVELTADALLFKSKAGRLRWPYETMRRMKLQQPIFGSNYIEGMLSDTKAKFKIWISTRAADFYRGLVYKHKERMKVLAHVGSVVAQASLNNPGAQVQVIGLAGGAIGVSTGFGANMPTISAAPGIPARQGGSAGVSGVPQVYTVQGAQFAMPTSHQQQQQRLMLQQQQQQQQLIQQQQQQIMLVSLHFEWWR